MGDSEDIVGYATCRICWEPIDYCPGHGAEGDAILARREMRSFLDEWLAGDHHANLTRDEVVARLFTLAHEEPA